MTGLPQWQGWAVVHSANGSKDYSGALSIVYVSRYDNKNVGRSNISDLATHMANYQPVLTELQVRVKKLKVQRIVRGWLARRQLRCLRLLQVTAPYLNMAPGTTTTDVTPIATDTHNTQGSGVILKPICTVD